MEKQKFLKNNFNIGLHGTTVEWDDYFQKWGSFLERNFQNE